MIESNGILGTLMSQSHAHGRSHLTDKQSQLVTDTLSKYDPNNLTEADAKEIASSFREAGIRPSKALKEAMLAEGFDAKEVVKKAGIRPIKALREAMMAEGLEAKMVAKKAELQLSRPNAPSGIKESFNVSENQLSELYKLLHQYHNNDSVDADRNSLLNSIQGVLGGIEMIGLKEVNSANETNLKMTQTV